jgi:hypothetical protein
MFTIQISDRNTYVRKAEKLHRPVKITPLATVVHIEESGRLVLHPALRVDYSMEFDDPSTGRTKWTFCEVVRADEDGNAQLPAYSLWAKLEKVDPPLNLQVLGDSFR